MWILRQATGTDAGHSQKMKQRAFPERELLDHFPQVGFVRRPLLDQAFQGPLDLAWEKRRGRFF